MAEEQEEKGIYGVGGILYCKDYQERKPCHGVTACRFLAKACPNGVHRCSGCGKPGHGVGDCKWLPLDPPRLLVPSKRPFSAFGGGVGGGGQRAIAPGTGTSVAMPAVHKAIRTSKLESPIDLMIWRPSDLTVHGFACLFQFSCSMMNKSCAERMPLYIDLNQSNSLYDSFTEPGSQAIWWNDIFLQPYVRTLQNEPEKVKCITDYMASWRVSGCSVEATENESIKVQLADPPSRQMIWNSSGVWGPSKDGGLNEDKVKETRALVEQYTDFTARFK